MRHILEHESQYPNNPELELYKKNAEIIRTHTPQNAYIDPNVSPIVDMEGRLCGEHVNGGTRRGYSLFYNRENKMLWVESSNRMFKDVDNVYFPISFSNKQAANAFYEKFHTVYPRTRSEISSLTESTFPHSGTTQKSGVSSRKYKIEKHHPPINLHSVTSNWKVYPNVKFTDNDGTLNYIYSSDIEVKKPISSSEVNFTIKDYIRYSSEYNQDQIETPSRPNMSANMATIQDSNNLSLLSFDVEMSEEFIDQFYSVEQFIMESFDK